MGGISRRVWFPAMAAVIFLAGGANAAPRYGYQELGTLGGYAGGATALNLSGQVVGFADLADSFDSHAFFWDAGGMRDLVPQEGISSALFINASGGVAGVIFTPDGNSRAFYWEAAGGLTVPDTLGGDVSWARGLNARGQVAGTSYLEGASGPHLALVWSRNEGMQALPTLGGQIAWAQAINDAGQVAGGSSLAESAPCHAFLWAPHNNPKKRMRDLGTLGGPEGQSEALDLNNRGEAAGYTTLPDGAVHACFWKKNAKRPQDLGTLGHEASQALKINNSSQVIGWLYSSNPETYRGFLWSKKGGKKTRMKDLGTLGGNYTMPQALNNLGQVVGVSADSSGQHRPFWWTAADGILDLNDLAVDRGEAILYSANAINDLGWIAGEGSRGAFVLVPVP